MRWDADICGAALSATWRRAFLAQDKAHAQLFIAAIVISAPDQPGALASISRRLADAGVRLQALVILGWHQGKAELALSVDDPDLARRVLGAHTPGAAVI